MPQRRHEKTNNSSGTSVETVFICFSSVANLLLCFSLMMNLQNRSFQGALRPALPTAGLIAYPVAGGVLEAGVSHVFIFPLLNFSLVAGRGIAGVIRTDKIRGFDRIDSSARNSIGPIGVIDDVPVRVGRAYLEIIEMNADRNVLLVILIQALSILLVSGVDEALEDRSLRFAFEIVRCWTRDGFVLVGVGLGLIGSGLVSGFIIICGWRVGPLRSADPLLINEAMSPFTTVLQP